MGADIDPQGINVNGWKQKRFGTGADDLRLMTLGEVRDDPKLRHGYVDMLRDFHTNDRKTGADGSTVIRGGDMAERFSGPKAWTPDRVAEDFDTYVAAQEALQQPGPMQLPTHTRVLVNQTKGQVVGEAWIRTPTDPIPVHKWGGHTHSVIRPSARGLGHGSAMLPLSMAAAHDLGVTEVHVNVNDDNPASYRRFDKMVGEGRAEIVPGEAGSGKRHYSIPTAPYASQMNQPRPAALSRP